VTVNEFITKFSYGQTALFYFHNIANYYNNMKFKQNNFEFLYTNLLHTIKIFLKNITANKQVQK